MPRGSSPKTPPIELPAPISPLGDGSSRARSELIASLERIDGWGQLAWKEIFGCWQLRGCRVRFAPQEQAQHVVYHYVDDEPNDVTCQIMVAAPVVAKEVESAIADWALRLAWRTLIAKSLVRAYTYEPSDRIVATNACYLHQNLLVLRLTLRLPMAGMCCDGVAFKKFVSRLEAFAAACGSAKERRSLSPLLLAVRQQDALRDALPEHDLVAFIGNGSLLARRRDGSAAQGCRPFRAQGRSCVTIDLGPLGRVRGLGIKRGVTALAGAPYHGKSTVLRAIADGRWNRRPGDGRNHVVSLSDSVQVQAEDGRRIKHQDIAGFFRKLPGAEARDFSTEHASGATSMAASVLQGIAGGAKLLLIDEDSAAGNFLAIDAGMRRLLGKSLAGTTTLVEVLRGLADHGVSTVLVAGSNQQSLACADRVVALDHFQPRDVTTAARRLARPIAKKVIALRDRQLVDDPDCLLGPRHFLTVDVADPYRPIIEGTALDLTRCGWTFDGSLIRGACCAAAWVCRLRRKEKLALTELKQRYEKFVADRSVRGLDPFETAFVAAAPWQLIVTVLERLPRPDIRSPG